MKYTSSSTLLVLLATLSLVSVIAPAPRANACSLHSSTPPMHLQSTPPPESAAEPEPEAPANAELAAPPTGTEAEAEAPPESGAEPLAGPASEAEAPRWSLARSLQLGLSARTRNLRFGDEERGHAELSEYTLLLGARVQLPGPVGVGLSLPLARRGLSLPNGARERTSGLGDVGLQADLALQTLWELPFRAELQLGLLLPTAPMSTRGDGEYLHPDVQPGAGVFAPRAGLLLGARAARRVDLLLQTDVIWAPESPDGVQRSATLRVDPALYLQTLPDLRLALALPLRHEWEARSSGQLEALTGGTLLSVEPRLSWSMTRQLTLLGGVSIPVVQALRGGARERVSAFAAIQFLPSF
ncbi:hypothetical protein DL240_19335 [Lujinxingia litoralis]|uniref:Transporter n=1 Tax=Lujinxingia litoralis TaxID=2211119 RepID=A0A328C670_9DELT|nr:hypothetical protein [Lujinxingia litoralis]RAL20004.1 hypothetical protein DL240_19335 [Lujinxingia litoralis]